MVLPWVPLTAMVRRSAQMAASRADRASTGTDRSRAPATSGLSGGTAVEMATASSRSWAGPRWAAS